MSTGKIAWTAPSLRYRSKNCSYQGLSFHTFSPGSNLSMALPNTPALINVVIAAQVLHPLSPPHTYTKSGFSQTSPSPLKGKLKTSYCPMRRRELMKGSRGIKSALNERTSNVNHWDLPRRKYQSLRSLHKGDCMKPSMM